MSKTIPPDIDFPNVPDGAFQIEDIRQPYVKASAYYTILLSELNESHSRDEHAAAVTDAVHSLKNHNNPEEYLNLIIQELAVAETEAMDEDFTNLADELKRLRNIFSSLNL